jgi:hypothetical protein
LSGGFISFSIVRLSQREKDKEKEERERFSPSAQKQIWARAQGGWARGLDTGGSATLSFESETMAKAGGFQGQVIAGLFS